MTGPKTYDRVGLTVVDHTDSTIWTKVRIIGRPDRVDVYGRSRQYGDSGADVPNEPAIRLLHTFDGSTIRATSPVDWVIDHPDGLYHLVSRTQGKCGSCTGNPLVIARL